MSGVSARLPRVDRPPTDVDCEGRLMRRPLTGWGTGVIALFCLATVAPPLAARAADWPMVGGNARHDASVDEDLPGKLKQSWAIDLPALSPAWPDQTRLRDDATYHP